MCKKLYLLFLISFFAQASENNIFLLEDFPIDVLSQYMSFYSKKSLMRTCKHFKGYFTKNSEFLFSNEIILSLNSFINAL